MIHIKALVRVFLAVAILAVPAGASVPDRADVVVIGAGLSGLATAYGLQKAGLQPRILELTPHIGGRVRTVHYKFDGQDIDADSGMEEYWESNPAVGLLRELGLPLKEDTALSSIVLDKKLVPLDGLPPTEFLKQLLGSRGYDALGAFKKKVGALNQEIEARKNELGGILFSDELLALKDRPFSKWVASQGLPPKVNAWIRVSLECEIGTGWDRISALDGIAEMRIFTAGAEGEMSYRVAGGNERFTEKLAARIGRDKITLNARVNRIVARGERVSVYYLDTARNVSGVVHARHVVSTIPLFRLFEVQFDPPLSARKGQAIASQTWGAYFKAHVFLPPEAPRRWGGAKESILPILSDSELGVIYDGNPEQEGKTRILSLLITGENAERFNMMPLDQARAEITAGLDRLWPGIAREIKGIEFYRYHPRAIAAWPPGRSRFDELSQEIRRPENRVYLAGDFTETSHSDGAFLSARRVVRQIVAAEKAPRARAPQATMVPAGLLRVSGIRKTIDWVPGGTR